MYLYRVTTMFVLYAFIAHHNNIEHSHYARSLDCEAVKLYI